MSYHKVDLMLASESAKNNYDGNTLVSTFFHDPEDGTIISVVTYAPFDVTTKIQASYEYDFAGKYKSTAKKFVGNILVAMVEQPAGEKTQIKTFYDGKKTEKIIKIVNGVRVNEEHKPMTDKQYGMEWDFYADQTVQTEFVNKYKNGNFYAKCPVMSSHYNDDRELELIRFYKHDFTQNQLGSHFVRLIGYTQETIEKGVRTSKQDFENIYIRSLDKPYRLLPHGPYFKYNENGDVIQLMDYNEGLVVKVEDYPMGIKEPEPEQSILQTCKQYLGNLFSPPPPIPDFQPSAPDAYADLFKAMDNAKVLYKSSEPADRHQKLFNRRSGGHDFTAC